MTEIWKPVPGYEGAYEVSNHGCVRSLDRTIIHKNGLRQSVVGRILRTHNAGRGYQQISLYGLDKKKSRYYVHRLVLQTFVGPAPPGYECNHRDGNKTNNRLDNLEWISRSANVEHAHAELDVIPLGEDHTNSKLTAKQVLRIRNQYARGSVTYKSLAQQFRVSYSAIGAIVHGRVWRHVGGPLVNREADDTRPNAKLTKEVVRRIRILDATGVPSKELARLFNCSYSNVRLIVTRETWKHID